MSENTCCTCCYCKNKKPKDDNEISKEINKYIDKIITQTCTIVNYGRFCETGSDLAKCLYPSNKKTFNKLYVLFNCLADVNSTFAKIENDFPNKKEQKSSIYKQTILDEITAVSNKLKQQLQDDPKKCTTSYVEEEELKQLQFKLMCTEGVATTETWQEYDSRNKILDKTIRKNKAQQNFNEMKDLIDKLVDDKLKTIKNQEQE